MDRQLIYPGQVPLEVDLLKTNQNTMVGLAKLSEALMGTSGIARGFATSQTVVPSLAVLVGPGEVYSQENLESTAFSSLPQDLTHSIVKQGLLLDAVTLAITPPGTAGFSINYLVQVDYQDTDSGSTVLAYYNATNPSVAYSGPANSGAAQPTLRKGQAIVSVKAGTAATTGTQTTPAPDAGKLGLYVVTVANGASTVVNANISLYTGYSATRKTYPNIQDEIATLVAAAGLTLDPNAANQVLLAVRKLIGGTARVKGLLGGNNSGTPNTQFDFLAAAVDLRDPATGAIYSVQSPASKTCNILTAGPAANGRDQAGAFTASSWVHFYYIYNPTTGAIDTIASASASAPAALPAGYIAWAYIGALYLSAGSVLAQGSFRGTWFQYTTAPAALTSGGATSLTPVSVAAMVPPNALQFEIYSSNLALTSNGSGGYGLTCSVSAGAGGNFQFGLQGVGVAGSVFGAAGTAKRLNNIAQTFSYQLTLGSGAGAIVSINVNGYSVPNGGE